MGNFAITREISGSVETAVEKVTEAIKSAGFGVLTRIDFDQKIQEKLGEKINRCVILGACNPKLALEAYRQSTDTALLIPCNIAVTEVQPGKVRIEAMRPTAMLKFLPAVKPDPAMDEAEKKLRTALSSL